MALARTIAGLEAILQLKELDQPSPKNEKAA